MKHSKASVARKINQLWKLKRDIDRMADRALWLADGIKAAGGGESKTVTALIVKMPKRTMVVKAHKQLRLVRKPKKNGR